MLSFGAEAGRHRFVSRTIYETPASGPGLEVRSLRRLGRLLISSLRP